MGALCNVWDYMFGRKLHFGRLDSWISVGWQKSNICDISVGCSFNVVYFCWLLATCRYVYVGCDLHIGNYPLVVFYMSIHANIFCWQLVPMTPTLVGSLAR